MLSLRSAQILVVEDDPDNLALITIILHEFMGAKLVTTEDGQPALTALEKQAFEFALIDLGLPVLNGWDLIEQIRQHSLERVRQLYCVALTGYAMAGDRERALALGYNEYITKPIDFLTFDDELRRALVNCPWYQQYSRRSS